ncbi:tRNA 2-thiouridine(34) synthase MnmA [Paenarthrobacter sp. Z7-10]|uniref:tRNA 2-thiouridine(34) synthase MnmA n=1 Tax=Paenarthrobacter sp. Z7-10 TaxID=2787635 RepID=UPI0022A8D46C|nr:tRNA 2-thiouridine(34) synthase MnmA [Paenarthrobacter sp. Z7-10]MCZ2402758.1 tRNA 2-thiouridine(34) synthase MnmA [Paenarthrobacter sp. Z7-10]
MRVLAAMSGGVDSAVAAARAVEAGHDVVGVHLALSRMPGTLRTGSRGCCTVEDSNDAWRACDKLGIPYYVWDFSERFKEDVVQDFIDEYAAGRTPNPCMRCNERIKFAALLEKALALGFDAVCTGHYAKVIDDGHGNKELHRAADWAKDQSYVLGVLTHEQLQHSMFPLAETPSKAEVRAEAERRGLSVAKKPDSHDICFIPDGDTAGWLAEKIDMATGDIVNEAGAKVGEHPGANAFTVGQRRGLKLGTPAADGKPRFVLEIRPKENKVVVGPEAMLAMDEIRGIKISWAGLPIAEAAADVSGEVQGPGSVRRSLDFDCMAQVRAHGDPVPARARVEWTADDDGTVREELLVTLIEPLRGVSPGQTVVLYQGTRVLGQATIDAARSLARPEL